jgi:hypothetical protein
VQDNDIVDVDEGPGNNFFDEESTDDNNVEDRKTNNIDKGTNDIKDRKTNYVEDRKQPPELLCLEQSNNEVGFDIEEDHITKRSSTVLLST